MTPSTITVMRIGITLPNDGNVSMEIPTKISGEGLAIFKMWMDAWWKKIEADSKTQEASS